MTEDLAEHVERLRRELNRLTGELINENFDARNNFMVGLERVKSEIDSLDSFVVRRHDLRCLSTLRQKITKYFSEDETKSLILELGISDFDYTGDTLSGFHTELVGFCDRRELLPSLIDVLKQNRSRVQWPNC